MLRPLASCRPLSDKREQRSVGLPSWERSRITGLFFFTCYISLMCHFNRRARSPWSALAGRSARTRGDNKTSGSLLRLTARNLRISFPGALSSNSYCENKWCINQLPFPFYFVCKHWRRDNLAPHNEAPQHFGMNTCVRSVVLINAAKVSALVAL